MRLFISLHLHNVEQMRIAMQAESQKLKPFVKKGNFTHNQNYHITLAFLGEVTEDEASVIKEMMSSVIGKKFVLYTNSVDTFIKKRGDVLFVKIKKNEILQTLFHTVRKQLYEIDFQIPSTYTPHITIGRNIRFEEDFNLETLDIPMVELQVSGLDLMLSHRKDGWLQYTPIFTKYFCEE